jgi:hypothetical protein
MRGRIIPDEPWGIQAMRMNIADDPDWFKKTALTSAQAIDEARIVSLETELIPALEAKQAAAAALALGGSAPENIKEIHESERSNQAVGSDGLTERERRVLAQHREQLVRIRVRKRGFRLQASGSRFQGLGFRVQAFGVQALGFRLQPSAFSLQALGFRV